MSWTKCNSLSCGAVLPFKSIAVDTLYDVLALMSTDVNAYKTFIGSQELPDTCPTDQLSFETLVCERRQAKQQACNDETVCINTMNLASTRTELNANIESRRGFKLEVLKLICKILHYDGTVDKKNITDSALNTCDATTTDNVSEFYFVMSSPETIYPNCANGAVDLYPSPTTWPAFRSAEYEVWSTE